MRRAPAPLVRILRARHVGENLPHHAREDGEKVRAVRPLHRRAAHQADESFIDQRRGLQNVVIPLAAEVVARDPVQFGVDDRRQPLQRGAVALAPCPEKRRQFSGWGNLRGHCIIVSLTGRAFHRPGAIACTIAKPLPTRYDRQQTWPHFRTNSAKSTSTSSINSFAAASSLDRAFSTLVAAPAAISSGSSVKDMRSSPPTATRLPSRTPAALPPPTLPRFPQPTSASNQWKPCPSRTLSPTS